MQRSASVRFFYSLRGRTVLYEKLCGLRRKCVRIAAEVKGGGAVLVADIDVNALVQELGYQVKGAILGGKEEDRVAVLVGEVEDVGPKLV